MNSTFESSVPFILFSSCQLVKGAVRGAICDLESGRFFLVPHSLVDILLKFNKKSFDFILAAIGNENSEYLREYFDFLKAERLIFFSKKVDLFPSLELHWNEPVSITNAIIEFRCMDLFVKSILQLDNFGCRYLELRLGTYNSTDLLNQIMDVIEGKTIISVAIMSTYVDSVESEKLVPIIDKYKRITSVTIFDAIEAKEFYTEVLNTPVVFASSSLNKLACGKISVNHFISYIDIFTESLAHNTCLNRKIAIDADGNIKNCPSMKESYGNICDTTLEEAINKPGFKKYWDIKKDDITKCKDCEFRHVCTDCRAYLDDPDDLYSAPLKCGYNPYTCEWEEWSTHPMKQKAIDHYNMRQIL